MPDSVSLGLVVLAAKTNAASMTASVTAGELGRWLGTSASLVRSSVRPRLQRGPAESWEAKASGSNRTVGITWQVTRLAAARQYGDRAHLLRLSKPEYATLLRLLEVLFAPGWSGTPPGLLAGRGGHGAATDRLALLLAVLHGRPDGTVRLCAGRVDGRGRLAATLARLLGRDSAEGERVLERLQTQGVVTVVHGTRERLLIPVVAEAFGRMRAEARAAGRAPRGPRRSGQVQAQAADATGGVDQNSSRAEKSQVTCSFPVPRNGGATVGLHAGHSPVAAVRRERVEVGGGFSGGAESVYCRQPGRASTHKDSTQLTPALPRQAGALPPGPLRGEKPTIPLSITSGQAAQGPTASGWKPGTSLSDGASGHSDRRRRTYACRWPCDQSGGYGPALAAASSTWCSRLQPTS